MAINRRRFILGMSGAGLALCTRRVFKLGGMLGAGTALGTQLDNLGVAFDASLTVDKIPRIINIFLYGGPSELAGNLSNIVEINANSQNPYGNIFDPNNASTVVTPNYFWSTAGGTVLEQLVASGDATVYRTMNRIKDQNRAHGICVQQNLVGNLDVYHPGTATTLAWILQNNNPYRNPDGSVRDLSKVVFPFVTFEGESKAFNRADIDIPPALKPIALNANLMNPYQRTDHTVAGLNNSGATDTALEQLARLTNGGGAYKLTTESLIQRAEAATNITAMLNNIPVPSSSFNYGTGNFGTRLSAAVSLILANPDTLYVSLGSSGLGGWDDHSEMLGRYPARMSEMMNAISAAVNHLNTAAAQGVAHADKVIVNVFGEFGRNVNLNESLGWDHGNNQNLYTFGGRGLASKGRVLGKIVGETQRIGDKGVNRQFTSPTANSYQFEPFAVASTLFKYFGVTNPELLSGEPPIAGA
ncbi:MAG: DUF1501 domain-containing protein [Pseudomonadota bacterium]|mgnify:CR=1 FL=1